MKQRLNREKITTRVVALRNPLATYGGMKVPAGERVTVIQFHVNQKGKPGAIIQWNGFYGLVLADALQDAPPLEPVEVTE